MKNRFTYDELLVTQTGLPNVPNEEQKAKLMELLEELNKIDWPKPIRVNSGFRSPEVNKKVGGSFHSHHMQGCCADLTCEDIWGLVKYLKKHFKGVYDQLIYYPHKKFCHIDFHEWKRDIYFEKI